jgi:hypothetical protein
MYRFPHPPALLLPVMLLARSVSTVSQTVTKEETS